MKRIAFSLIALFTVSGCLHAANAQNVDQETVDQLSSALTKLTAAVDVHVAEQRGRISGDDDDVIGRSIEHDKGLLDPFRSYHIRLLVEGRDSAVLVCTQDRSRGLVEDVGCKAGVSRKHFPQSIPCEFTISPSQECKR